MILLASLTPPRGGNVRLPPRQILWSSSPCQRAPRPSGPTCYFCTKSRGLLAGDPSLAVLYAFAPLLALL